MGKNKDATVCLFYECITSPVGTELDFGIVMCLCQWHYSSSYQNFPL